MVNNKRSVQLLPVALQTETLNKFFAATLDHMLQPESVEFLSGYIGSKPSYYDKSKDYYVGEPTKLRSDYQLPVTAISVDPNSGKTNNIMFYDDIVGLLKFYGANTSSHTRLFDQEYYSWAPPIDLNKFLNYNKYYWLPEGLDAISLLDRTTIDTTVLNNATYTYVGTYMLASGEIITGGSFAFTNSLTIIPTKDTNPAYNNKKWDIDGVGLSIKLRVTQNVSNTEWDLAGWGTGGWESSVVVSPKQYVTIGRYSVDRNQWSTSNRWYHEDAVLLTKTDIGQDGISKAIRPIIEFSKNLELWNYGWFGRPNIDLVLYNIANVFNEVVGKPSFTYDGVTLEDGMRILVLGDSNENFNSRIYLVSGITLNGVISLTMVPDGQNADGSPALGDRMLIKSGTYGGTNIWYDNSGNWHQGQQYSTTALPLFGVCDADGNSLRNTLIYPGSDSVGNKLFSYVDDSNSIYDSELGFNPKRDQFGAFVFSNDLSTTPVSYLVNNVRTLYEGYQFYRIIPDDVTPTVRYGNNWHNAPNLSRQYLVNDYEDITVVDLTIGVNLSMDQLPAEQIIGQLPNILVYKISDQTKTKLTHLVDYTVNRNLATSVPQVTIKAGIIHNGDRVIIKSWNPSAPESLNGYYELPINLTANPNNREITTISQNQITTHFTQIMENQHGFVGNPLGSNNFSDTAADMGLGLSILQHRAPMLKLMALNSGDVTSGILNTQSKTDPMLAMQFTQREYIRFYSKLVRVLENMRSNGFGLYNPTSEWISVALKQINIGKTPSSAWANSGYDVPQGADIISTNPTYVPMTPTRLGITPTYMPTVYLSNSRLILQTHEGSRIVLEDSNGSDLGTIIDDQTSTNSPLLLTNPIAKALLQFELNIYDNIPTIYKDVDAFQAFNLRRQIPGKWRKTDYTFNEYKDILRPMFDKWVILNQVDYQANTTFDLNDQFTFNYNNMVTPDGEPVPGNWRGIYKWYYDTDRPHSHPWEMIGFTQKPTWWEDEYGAAPWTNGNAKLWQDLSIGLVRQGNRQGAHATWARPGLMSCIPVDAQGNLLPPMAAGTITSLPSIAQARADWVYGDGGPIESVWAYSQDHTFALAQAGYLMKPAQFIEYCWDPLRTKQIYASDYNSQWIYINTNSRRGNNQFYVHRENPVALSKSVTIPNENTSTYFSSAGIQHLISEYLVSQSFDVSKYLGWLVRKSQPQLAHKVGSFVNSDHNSLRVTADSFGTIGYRSSMIPSENINTYLYRSSSIGESFYGAVLVKQVSTGWQVYGFDGIDPHFSIVPSNTNAASTNIVIGNQSVTAYAYGQEINKIPVVERVPYGTVFTNRQAVYDFILGYGRWLIAEGWVFDGYDQTGNTITDWNQAAREYVLWSQSKWANGNFIALSPFANSAKFKNPFGNIEFVNGIVKGTYPVLDRSGGPIEAHNLEILRYEDEIVVRPLNEQSIYGLRLFRTTIEHVIVFSNTTSFNDIIYDDIYNTVQPRLKLYAYRTNNWTGRLDAPGYFLYQNPTDNTWSMISNFEKTATDIRHYFNLEQPRNYDVVDPITGAITTEQSDNSVVDRADISSLAKHLYGYQDRQYLHNLLLEDSTEFQFYQGFIKQKGTQATIEKILRNDSILPSDGTFKYYEEYAMRTGRFGSLSLNKDVSFIIPQDQYVNNPQQINVFGDLSSSREADGIIDFIRNDSKFIVRPENWESDRFTFRSLTDRHTTDLPTAGYVKLAETDWYVVDYSALLTLYTDNLATKPLLDNDTIWQFRHNVSSWTVWQFSKSPANVVRTIPSSQTGNPTTLVCDAAHGLNNGDLVTLVNISNVDVLNNTFSVQNVDATGTMFDVPQSTFIEGAGGNVYVYHRVRFASSADRDNNPPPGGWQEGNLAYCDGNNPDNQGWTVYEYMQGEWVPIRQENLKIDPSLLLGASLFSLDKKSKLARLTYYDPAKGIIPGLADIGIDSKSVYDPAKYTSGDTSLYNIAPDEAWGDEKTGVTWWDLSTVRYIDYEIADTSYRWSNWGKIAPGTTVDVYQWVRSPVPPSSWDTYVSQNKAFTQFGVNYSPTGIVKNSANPAWSQRIEYDSSGAPFTWYYFWVSSSTTIPINQNKTLTTVEITNLLTNPSAYGVEWYAAIDSGSIIVANISKYLHNDDTVMQLIYTDKVNDGADHKQWSLIREGDAASTIPDIFWSKMRDSLTGYDSLKNPVPDITLHESQRYGTLIRPRQSWFKDRQGAARIYVDKVNSLLSAIPLRDDTGRTNWTTYFFAEEALPTFGVDFSLVVDSPDQLTNITVTDGTLAFVKPTITTNYLWAIYQWSYASLSWSMVRLQEWKTPNFWDYVNWYDASNNVSASTIPAMTVDVAADMYKLTVANNTVVKVLNNGNNLWELYKLIDAMWVRVGLESGTVQIKSGIYDGSTYIIQYGEGGFDSSAYDMDPYVEFAHIINGVRYAIFGDTTSANTIELNSIFFSMINYVLAEQSFVDWIFKTSNIVLKGFNNPLSAGDLYKSDNIDNLLGYINEMRPYRSKIRQYVSARTAEETTQKIAVLDYDRPPHNGVILDGTLVNDATVLESDPAYTPWTKNYKSNPQLIRNMQIQLVFDRVASVSDGWGTGGWETLPWEYESGADATFGAFDRIVKYYAPTGNMIPIDSEYLISGTAYKGAILDTIGFNIKPGWNRAPWNFGAGWNASTQNFDPWLDVILQGGAIPQYDIFYGDNRKTVFRLSKAPQDVAETAVWSNGVLRTYGVDWVIPNYVTDISIVEPGVGYAVGDVLTLDVKHTVTDARIQVSIVGPNGELLKAQLISNGNYDMVPHGEVGLKTLPYTSSVGVNALIEPSWGGSSLVFKDAPNAEPGPSVYVLYAGDTFEAAPDSDESVITDGGGLIQPYIAEDHAEELYNASLRNSIRMDVYTSAVGGHPTAYLKQYKTDGIRDQFDLGIQPQDDNSVIATLNGKVLQYGISKDYVINFYTNTIVFMLPPVVGTLQLMTFGTGGTGVSLATPYITSAGSGYDINDVITLTDGHRPTLSAGPGHMARISITSVKAVTADIVFGGTGYSMGDTLVLASDSVSMFKSPISLTVTGIVPQTGAIAAITIDEPGEYTVKPLATNWLSTSTGTGLQIDITWGAVAASVVDQGLYIRKPTTALTQYSVTHSNVTVYGSGITVSGGYSNTVGSMTVNADGIANQYTLPFGVQNVQQLLVTVDGAIIDSNTLTLVNGVVTLPSIPDAYSVVTLTGFNTQVFSVIREYDFTVVNAQYTYTVPTLSSSTRPQYPSTIVIRNGSVMRPPPTTTITADGITAYFAIAHIPVSLTGVSVYLDDQLLTSPADYTIDITGVTFTTTPYTGASIMVVALNTVFGYDYSISTNTLVFPNNVVAGDNIRVLTFSEDLSYGWVTDNITSTGATQYTLQQIPSDTNSAMVVVNGSVLNLLYDYTIDTSNNSATITFNASSAPTAGQIIYVTYATQLNDKPPIAWRTLLDGTGNSKSIALDNHRRTTLLANVFVYSTEIDVADITCISDASDMAPGSIWIGDELISYAKVTPSATNSHPNRGILENLIRGDSVTSSSPRAVYNTLYYNGDGQNIYFAAESGTVPLAETLFVDGQIQVNTAIDPNRGSYGVVTNPVGKPAGRYFVFKTAPPVGWKNIRIAALNVAISNNNPVHTPGSIVIDAGNVVRLPGGYQWESAPNGLQYSNSGMATFLKKHQGTNG